MRVSGPAGVVRPVEAPVCPQIKSTHTACAQHITQGDTHTRSMGLPLHSAHTRRVARAHARTHSHNNTSHNTRKRKGVVDGQHDFRQIAYTLKRARTRAFTYIHTPIHIHTHTHTLTLLLGLSVGHRLVEVLLNREAGVSLLECALVVRVATTKICL